MSSTYWPHLRKELIHATANTTQPSLRCTICLDEMDSRQEASHEAVVLPCGHIFGRYCIQAWISSFIGENAPSCPTCRVEVVHPGCGHVAKMIPVPAIKTAQPQHMCQAFTGRSSNVENTLKIFSTAVKGFHRDSENRIALYKFPLTVPEGGAIRQRCADCYVQELLGMFTTIASPMSLWTVIGAPEFIGVTAKAAGQRWVLHSRGMRVRVLTTIESRPELLQAFHELRTSVESAEKRPSWPIDLEGLEFSLCLCQWEDPSGWT